MTRESISSDKDEEKQIDPRLDLATRVMAKTLRFIPYAGNKPDIRLGEIPFRRAIQLIAMRTRGGTKDEKGILKEIQAWNMDTSQVEDHKLDRQYLRFTLSYQEVLYKVSFTQLYALLNNMPGQGSKRCHKDGAQVSGSEVVEGMAKRAVKWGIGNCHEYAALALMFLQEDQLLAKSINDFRKNVEILWLDPQQGGRHVFVVIGRDPDAPYDDLAAYGKDAILLDPWYKEVGYIHELLADKENSGAIQQIRQSQRIIKCFCRGEIGGGHSERWGEKRTQKKEPPLLSLWFPKVNHPYIEHIPFARQEQTLSFK